MPRTHSYHLHLPHLSFDNSRELRLLYAIRTARGLVNRLAAFFVPLFLFKMGDGLFPFLNISSLQRSILVIAIYYFIYRLVIFVTAIPVGKIMSKIGFGRSFVVGNLIYALTLVFFQLSDANPPLVFVASILNGIQSSFFWVSYHAFFSNNAKKSSVGKDLGVVQFLLNLTAMISPALGGIIIVTFGYQYLFMIGLIIILVSLIVSLMMKSKKIRDEVSWKEYTSWLKEKTYRRLFLSFGGRYINDTVRTLWPLYIFLILGSVDRVGYLYTFSIFLALMVSYFIGSFADKNKKGNKPLLLSGSVLSLMWLVKTQIFSVWSIAFVDVVDRLTASFTWLIYDRSWMMRGRGKEALSYFLYREMDISIMAFFFWIIFLAFFFVFSNGWSALFIFASVGVMLSMLIKDK